MIDLFTPGSARAAPPFAAILGVVQRVAIALVLFALTLLLDSCSVQTARSDFSTSVPLDVAVYLSPELCDLTFVAEDWNSEVQAEAHPVDVKVGGLTQALLRKRLPESFRHVDFTASLQQVPRDFLILVPAVPHVEAHRLERKVDGEVMATVDMQVALREATGKDLMELSRVSSGSYNPRQRPNLLLGLVRIPVLAADLALVVPELMMGAKGPVGDTMLFVRREYSEAVLSATSQALEEILNDFRSNPRVLGALDRHRALIEDPRGFDQRLDSLVTKLLGDRNTGTIAVLDFNAAEGKVGAPEQFSAEELRKRIGQHASLVVVGRDLQEKVLRELRLKPADLVNPEHLREFGRLSSADVLVIGTTTDLGVRVRVDARLFEVETGKSTSEAAETFIKDAGP